MIYGAVAGIMGPMLYSLYKERMAAQEADDEYAAYEEMRRRSDDDSGQMSGEDIRKEAEAREAEEMAKQEAKWREYDEQMTKDVYADEEDAQPEQQE